MVLRNFKEFGEIITRAWPILRNIKEFGEIIIHAKMELQVIFEICSNLRYCNPKNKRETSKYKIGVRARRSPIITPDSDTIGCEIFYT